MRIFVASLLMLAIAMSSHSQVSFSISGQCPEGTEKVLISDIGAKSVLAEVAVVNGTFHYSVMLPSLSLLGVDVSDRHIRFFVDSTDVAVDLRDGSLVGSELNVMTAKCISQIDSVTRRHLIMLRDMEDEWKTAEVQRKKELEKEVGDIMKKVGISQIEVLKNYKHTLVPAAFLSEVYSRMSLSDLDYFMDSETPYYNHPLMSWVKIYYAGKQKRRPGILYSDFLMNDLEGKPRSLSEWCAKGNHVLVDFWASWCGPCRSEIPTIIEGYVKYHKKGFEVIGVSFDDKESAWKAAVHNLGMDWVQLSDLKGWKSSAAELYGVSSIPSNILIDGQGLVVASDLRGEELLDKLKEIYGF